MRLEFFTVPVSNPVEAQGRLNRFLAQHRVLSVDRQLVTEHGSAVWAICVTYLDGAAAAGEAATPSPRGKVDYKEVFCEADFAVFASLRTLRKEKAHEAGIPLYSVFTNEQLADMVKHRVQSKSKLAAIAGVGAARVDKYGDAFLAVLRDAFGAPAEVAS